MIRARSLTLVGLVLSIGAACSAQPAGPATQSPLAPTVVNGLADDAPFFEGATYDASVPTQQSIVGFGPGERAATHAQIEACFKAWDGKGAGGARAKLFEHGQTWEGRTLYHMVIASPENMARIEQIREGMAKLADPRGLSDAERDRLVNSLPAIAWMSYSIHGDETSGSDAALGVAYRMIAGNDEETNAILRDVVVIIDPMMNPDGRDRFLKMVAESRAAHPNVDDQSLLHSGYWPWGRTNHYMFDLNRDWIFGVHPETRGRIAAVRQWNPQLFLDAHEMESQDTFLFSPPRAPFNPFHPESRLDSMRMLSKAIAADFDKHGWRYYTGEWNEGWYPGYSDAWAAFGGAVGVLFEQARLAEDGVLRREGTIEPYRTAVRKQATASLSLLKTVRSNKAEMLRGFAAERAASVKGDGAAAWALRAPGNPDRLRRLANTLRLQGIEVEVAGKGFKASGKDRFGHELKDAEFAEGTLIVRRAQPNAALASALLEFDPRMPNSFLQDERRELLRKGQSKLYDTTAWNLGMMFDLDVAALDAVPDADLMAMGDDMRLEFTLDRNTPVGWIGTDAGDNSLALAARLMERGVEVRIVAKPFPTGEGKAARGTVIVLRVDNTLTGAALEDIIQEEARATRTALTALATGMGENDEPDLGGEHFPLLERPRIAILSRAMLDHYSVGECWFNIDQRLGIRATLLDGDTAKYADLRRYNVLIVGDAWGESPVSTMNEDLARWVEEGGTLIAIGSSAAAAAQDPGEDGENKLSSVRLLPDVLGDLAAYERQVLREWAGRMETIDDEVVWSDQAPETLSYPWEGVEALPDEDELKKRDAWQAMFMPQGAFVAARTDDEHWLTCGVGEEMSLLAMGDNILMAAEGVEAPVRIGALEPAPDAEKAKPAHNDDDDDADKAPERARRGWSAIPEGNTLRVRLSGLLWPEASARLANSAYVTRERVGNGQVILFASSPTFRGAALGSTRLFLNAVVYGPGCGADGAILP